MGRYHAKKSGSTFWHTLPPPKMQKQTRPGLCMKLRECKIHAMQRERAAQSFFSLLPVSNATLASAGMQLSKAGRPGSLQYRRVVYTKMLARCVCTLPPHVHRSLNIPKGIACATESRSRVSGVPVRDEAPESSPPPRLKAPPGANRRPLLLRELNIEVGPNDSILADGRFDGALSPTELVHSNLVRGLLVIREVPRISLAGRRAATRSATLAAPCILCCLLRQLPRPIV